MPAARTIAIRSAAEVIAPIGLGAVTGGIWILSVGGGTPELLIACAAIAASSLLLLHRPTPDADHQKG